MRCSPIIGRAGAPEIVFDILTPGDTSYLTAGYTKCDIQVIGPGAGGAWSNDVTATPAGGGAGGSHGWIIGLDISTETQLNVGLASPGAGRSTHGAGNPASTSTFVSGVVLGSLINVGTASGGTLTASLAPSGNVSIKSGAGTSRGSGKGGQGAEGYANAAWLVGGGGGAGGRDGNGGDGSGQSAATNSGGGGGGQRGAQGSSNRGGGGGGGVGLGPKGTTGAAQSNPSRGGFGGSGGANGDGWNPGSSTWAGGAFGGGGGAGGSATSGGPGTPSGDGAPGAIRIRLYN